MNEIPSTEQQSLTSLLAARPVWVANETAANALNLDRTVLLHAGPPYRSPEEIPYPVLNSAAVALVFERQAETFDNARDLIRSGQVSLQPAQNYSTVVPLAGVVSSSMWLHKIVDSNNPRISAYSPLNGGNGPAMRLGLCSESTLRHLRWINSELIQAISECQFQGTDLLEVAREALQCGDDCHGRTVAATTDVRQQLQPNIANFPEPDRFLQDSPSFALNLLMAAAKCLLLAAENYAHSSVVTAAGGNGIQVGLQVSGHPGKWLTAEAEAPLGDLGAFPQSRALGAIGDSAVVDIIGFGAMALSYAPLQRDTFRPHLPEDAEQLPNMLLANVHEAFHSLKFRTGLNARTVIETNTTPIVSLGVIDREGLEGRLGGGIYRYPINIFQNALNSVNKE